MIAGYHEQSIPLQAAKSQQLIEELLCRLVLLGHWTIRCLPKCDIAGAENQLRLWQIVGLELALQETQQPAVGVVIGPGGIFMKVDI